MDYGANNNSKLTYIRTALIVLSVCHLVLMVLYFVAGLSAVFMGMMEMFCASLLLCAMFTYSHSMISIYIIIVGIDLLTVFVNAGLSVQHNMLYGWAQYRFIVYVLAIFVYIFALVITLSAYKEYKYIQLYGPREISFSGSMPSYLGAGDATDTSISNNISNSKGYTAFSGKGKVVG